MTINDEDVHLVVTFYLSWWPKTDNENQQLWWCEPGLNIRFELMTKSGNNNDSDDDVHLVVR